MEKNFDNWHSLKKNIQARNAPQFNEREIWWCSVGVNIGFEEDGKNNHFERPVLVFRKFSKDTFLAIPLTSVDKDNNSPYYMNYPVNNKSGSLILSQLRLMSASRLNRKMDKMAKSDYTHLRVKLNKLLFKSESLSG
jgi:mRNA interferase MazF